MTVGTVEVDLVLREARSLKDKRRVIKSLKDRIRNRFNMSIAEVDRQNSIQRATLGLAMVGTDPQYVNGALSQAVEFIRNCRLAELIDYDLVLM